MKLGTRNFRMKQIRQRGKASSEKGNSTKKGATCKTNPMKKFFFTNPKAYKHRDYPAWNDKAKAMSNYTVRPNE